MAAGASWSLAYLRAGRSAAFARRHTFTDHPADLYLDEALAAPTYSQRVKANVAGVVDVLRGRTGQIRRRQGHMPTT